MERASWFAGHTPHQTVNPATLMSFFAGEQKGPGVAWSDSRPGQGRVSSAYQGSTIRVIRTWLPPGWR